MKEEDLKNLENEEEEIQEGLEGEGKEKEPSQEQEETEAEAKARKKGWLPEEEYEGEHEWIDAEDFLKQEPIRGALHRANREAKRMKKMNEEMKKMLHNAKKTAKEQAMKELSSQYEQALEENNVKDAVEIHSEMKTLEKDVQEEDTSEEPNEDFVEWLSENSWYEEDKELKDAANSLGAVFFAQDREAPLSEVYDKVAKRIKVLFPEKFGKVKPRATNVDTSVRRSRPVTRKSKSPTYDSLPDEAQEIYKLVVKSKSNPNGAFETGEEYIQAYLQGGGSLRNRDGV